MIKFRVLVRCLIATVGKSYILFLLIPLGGLASQANGQEVRQINDATGLSTATAGKLIDIEDTQILIPNVKVFNHHGKQVSFYNDLVKNKVVLMSFFYTSCTYICISQGENLSKVQALLGTHLGKEVFLISVSMDPRTDTPQKLKYWGRAFHAKTGWTLVSSDTPEMNRMLKAFTGNKPGPQSIHASLVFIGNDKTGKWMMADGLLNPTSLVKLLEGEMQSPNNDKR